MTTRRRSGCSVDTSEWSRPCSFVADLVAPTAPTVTSEDYPPGEIETPAEGPGEFTFDAGGNTDTAGFEYGWGILSVPGREIGEHAILRCFEPFAGANTVRVNAPGGTAIVTLTPPGHLNVLLVRTIAAGSPRTSKGQPGSRHTETCWRLSLVNGSLVHPSHRSAGRIPASSAIRSISAGQA